MSTPLNTQIQTGLLAYGMSGKVFHAPFLQAHPGFILKAVAERNQKNAQQDYPDVISYDSIDELLSDTAIELVVINTPNNLHFEHSKLALEREKHILVEKPFTATSAQAKILFDLADQKGRQIFFYQNRRWDSDFLSVKQVLDSGSLGKLNELHIRFDRYRNVIGPKAFKEKPVEASGLLYDLGPHLLDQVIGLFGRPKQFSKTLAKNRKDTLVDDFFTIHLQYDPDVSIFLTASMLVVDPQAAFVLHGVNGSYVKQRSDVQEEQLLAGIRPVDEGYGVEAEDQAGQLTIIHADGNKTQERIISGPGQYLSLFDAVYDSLIQHVPYPVKREDIIIQLEILES